MSTVRHTSVVLIACFFLLAVFAAAQTPLRMQTVTPCRLVDTRPPSGSGQFQGTMNFNLPQLAQSGGAYGSCPHFDLSTAQAYSLNVTLIPYNGQRVGYLTIWPYGQNQPNVSLMNSLDGRTKANAAIVPSGTNGEVSVYVTNYANVLIDINAYFDAASDSSALAFFPLPPCRIVDTRTGMGGTTLQPHQTENFTIGDDAAGCGIPSDAMAYSLNMTALPGGLPINWMEVWPAGQSQPTVSVLNDPTGTNVANAAIVPAGTNAQVTVLVPNNPTNLLIDTNGYFAAANSASNPLSLYTLTPCRVLDTRNGIGPFQGTLPVGVVGSLCGIPSAAHAFTFNATILPQNGPARYLTLWPEGLTIPSVSTLNALDGAYTSNMAIVPAGTGNESIDVFNSGSADAQLLLDVASYFAPIAPVNIANSSPLPNATNGSGYSVQLVATGGVAPYTWQKTGGTLPPNVTLSSAGLISGTAGGSGPYNFTVQATDSNSPAGTASASLQITVNTSAGSLGVLTTGLPNGTVNTYYNALLAANGGITPYTWSIASGSLPSGMSLNASTGLISGVPAAAGLSNFTVMVADSLHNTAMASLALQINTGNGNGSLNGMYAGSFTGFDHANFFAGALSFTADGNGNITGGEVDSNNASSGVMHSTITGGTYSIGSNGLGQINANTSDGGSIDLLISAATAEYMRIIGYNQNGSGTSGSGSLRQQNPSDFSETTLAGTWAFGYQGLDSSGEPIAGDGVLTATSNGNVTGTEDINDYGTHTQTSLTGNATSSIDSNGRATVQYQVQGVGTINLAVYAVSANETLAIEIDNGGALYTTNSLRQSGGPFSNGSMNGGSVARGSGIQHPGSGPTSIAIAALITASGNGNASFNIESNSGGNVGDQQEAATYTIASNGRMVFTASDGSQLVCYLVEMNEVFCLNVPTQSSNAKGAEITFAEPQLPPTGGFSNASFSGEYLGGSLPQYLSLTGTYTQVDSNLASGNGSFSSTYSQCGLTSCPALNQTLSATYSVSSNGAITISQNSVPVYEGFLISPNKAVYISATPNSVPLSILEVTSSAP